MTYLNNDKYGKVYADTEKEIEKMTEQNRYAYIARREHKYK